MLFGLQASKTMRRSKPLFFYKLACLRHFVIVRANWPIQSGFKDLIKFTQLVIGRVGIWTQAFLPCEGRWEGKLLKERQLDGRPGPRPTEWIQGILFKCIYFPPSLPIPSFFLLLFFLSFFSFGGQVTIVAFHLNVHMMCHLLNLQSESSNFELFKWSLAVYLI